jgi:D-glycero-alpha-D-manno-heptose-7-phosphate kinase
LLNETWQNQKRVHPAVTTRQIDDLFAAAMASGAMGGKVCGAGGGGCLVFLVGPGREDAVRRVLAGAGAQVLEFEFDLDGVRTWEAPGTRG